MVKTRVLRIVKHALRCEERISELIVSLKLPAAFTFSHDPRFRLLGYLKTVSSSIFVLFFLSVWYYNNFCGYNLIYLDLERIQHGWNSEFFIILHIIKNKLTHSSLCGNVFRR
jgi:hypothetical protein